MEPGLSNANYENNFTDFKNHKLSRPLRSNNENADNSFEPTWKQSLAALGSYVDLLAPELLAVWDICETVPAPETKSNQKVLNWLESSTSNHLVTQSQDVSDHIPTPINTQELINVSQEYDLIDIDDSSILQEMFLPKVKSN